MVKYEVKYKVEPKTFRRMEWLRKETGISLQRQSNAALAFFLDNVIIGEGVNFGKKLYLKRVDPNRKPIEIMPAVSWKEAEYMRNLNPDGMKKKKEE